MWITILCGLSGCIAWQGWKGGIVSDDSVPNIESATSLLNAGVLPSRGLITSYNSVAPPGAVWLYVPGVHVFSDYRLFELCGSVLLNGGTLIGLFILVHLAFSRATARVAILLYALSPIGLFFARSLWPVGWPCFVVWFVIWIVLWHRTERARHLVAALITIAAGMYVHMELAPLVLVAIAVWYRYRLPLQMKPVLVAALVSLLIWFPYLRFEQTRRFRDIASMILQIDILPREYGWSLCDPTLREEVLKQSGYDKISVLTRIRDLVRSRPRAAVTGLFADFQVDRFSFEAVGRQTPSGGGPKESASGGFLRVAISGCLLATVAAVMAFLGVFYLREASRVGSVSQPGATERRIIVLALAVPWVALLLTAEPLIQRRYLFLWPLQIALLAYCAVDLLGRWISRRPIRLAVRFALVAAVVINPTVLARLRDWQTNGWSGADSDMVRTARFIAQEVHRHGRNFAAIGYSIPWSAGGPRSGETALLPWGGDDAYHAIDSRYKIGLDMDYVLDQLFGIQNSDRCPEGISVTDDYVVVRLGPDPDPAEYLSLRARVLSNFQRIGGFGDYVVLARAEPPARSRVS